MKRPADDRIVLIHDGQLNDRDRRRLVLMREQSELGAVEIRIKVEARAAGPNAWRPLKSAKRAYMVHSAMDAERVIQHGPIEGAQFHTPQQVLEHYEDQHRRKS